MTGGCQCGAVRYSVAALGDIGICHCRMCQKAVGNLFGAYASVKTSDLVWTRGTPTMFQSSSAAARDFCRDCGTPLTFRYLASDVTEITIGSLDDPAAARPAQEFGVESRLPWLHEVMAGGLAQVITDPESKFLAGAVSYQFPAGGPDGAV